MDSDVILGAGLAGLSAGLCLLDKGRKVLLVEASEKFSVKTCGEFISYESIPLLEKWGIRPRRLIHNAHFHYKHRTHSFELPSPCGSMPRLDLENALLALFIKKGGEVQMGTKANHNQYEGHNLIISAGRWQGKPPTKPKYFGIKNHLTMTPPPDLHMFFTGNSYYGLSPLTESKAVISCLSKSQEPPPLPEGALPCFDPWLSIPIGQLGMKKLPSWPNTYFLGDAAGTIAPLSGGGMTMALTSGVMAAKFIAEGKWREFQKAWRKRYQRRIQISKMLNRLAFTPALLPFLFRTIEKHPKLLTRLFNATRE